MTHITSLSRLVLHSDDVNVDTGTVIIHLPSISLLFSPLSSLISLWHKRGRKGSQLNFTLLSLFIMTNSHAVWGENLNLMSNYLFNSVRDSEVRESSSY